MDQRYASGAQVAPFVPSLSICSPPRFAENTRDRADNLAGFSGANRKLLGSKENLEAEELDFEDENVPPAPTIRPLSDRVKQLAKPKQKVTFDINCKKPPAAPPQSSKSAASKPPNLTSGAGASARKTLATGSGQKKPPNPPPKATSEVAELKKQVSEQSKELETLKEALKSRESQIDRLVQLVDQLVAGQSKEEKAASSKPNISQSADAGTDTGRSLLVVAPPPCLKTERNVVAVQTETPKSPKVRKHTVAEMLKHAEPPPETKIDKKELAEIDKDEEFSAESAEAGENGNDQRQFFQDMMSLAQKWLQKDSEHKETPASSAKRPASNREKDLRVEKAGKKSEWSTLLSQAKHNQSLSMELNALAMKYLGDEELGNFASRPEQRRRATAAYERQCHTPPAEQRHTAGTRQIRRQMVAWEQQVTSFENNTLCLSPGYSMATKEFLGRHGLAPGYAPANQKPPSRQIKPANQRKERKKPTKKFEIRDIDAPGGRYGNQRLTPVQESVDFQEDSSFMQEFAARPVHYEEEDFSCADGNVRRLGSRMYGSDLANADEFDEECEECEQCNSMCDCQYEK